MTYPPFPKQNATGQTRAGINKEKFPKATNSSPPSSQATLNQLSRPHKRGTASFKEVHTRAHAQTTRQRGVKSPGQPVWTFNSCTGTKTQRGAGVRECPQDTRLGVGAGLVYMHTFAMQRVSWKNTREAHGTGVSSGGLGGQEWGGRWALS